MNLVQRLKGKKNLEGMEYNDMLGYLTKEDMKKLSDSAKIQRSIYRKTTYTTWNCRECLGTWFYSVIKCPACESPGIEKVITPTKYRLA